MIAITTTQITFAILVMALITFTMRYVFFSNLIKIQLNARIKTLLLFTAPCVLTAMTIPIMFQDVLARPNADGVDSFAGFGIFSLLQSRYFLASLVAIVLSIYVRQTLLVIGISMLVFYAIGYVV